MSTARVLSFVKDSPVSTPASTREAFIHAVRAIVAPRVADAAARERLLGAKLVYGAGAPGLRGVCYFSAWTNGEAHDFIEVTALGEESHVQLAGTTIHELAHSLAGHEAGHGRDWKAAAKVLGLEASVGQTYAIEHFDAAVWAAIEALPLPADGRPTFRSTLTGRALPTKPRPCPLGVGTRGGKSRGVGSGSRLRLWLCGCHEGTVGRKVRVASDDWDATCNRCGERYAKAEARQ